MPTKTRRITKPRAPKIVIKKSNQKDENINSTQHTSSHGGDDVKAVAKRFFHKSWTGRTVGRIEEKLAISAFLDGPFGQKGLYIAGHPGTGKTAVVTELLASKDPASHLMLNCIMLGSVKAVIQAVCRHFKVACITQIEHGCVVLDEIDYLAARDVSFVTALYSRTAMLKVIGIANTLDLAVSKLSTHCRPVSFQPYTHPDITAIIADRMEHANRALGQLDVQLIDPTCVELCARKVATTGDLRRALDLLQEAITLSPGLAFSGVQTGTSKRRFLVDLPVFLKTVEKLLPSRPAVSQTVKLLEQANLHQKLILLSMLQLRKKKLEARPRLNIVYDCYADTCAVVKASDRLERSDFLDAIGNLESIGFLKCHNTTTGKTATDTWQRCISLQLDPKELTQAIINVNNPILTALVESQTDC